MTMPADELATAANTLRGAAFRGAVTATPAVAALLRARGALADWLDFEADLIATAPHTTIGPRLDRALTVARHINQHPAEEDQHSTVQIHIHDDPPAIQEAIRDLRRHGLPPTA